MPPSKARAGRNSDEWQKTDASDNMAKILPFARKERSALSGVVPELSDYLDLRDSLEKLNIELDALKGKLAPRE